MGTVQVKQVDRIKTSFWEKSYIPEFARGLAITSKHFFSNLLSPQKASLNYAEEAEEDPDAIKIFTREYPDASLFKGEDPMGWPDPVYYSERYRGVHRLMKRENGDVRCVACMCCSTICPANCIHIEAAEHDDPTIEKYPRVFVIDELRCIFCGLCVEACPCDAIRMDTGVHMPPFADRGEAFLDRDALMTRGTLSAAKQGGVRGLSD